MIEKIITSKTRTKLLKLFLTNIDDRYYLRELERKLDESLSPLRRQLVKLEKMGILVAEYEANLKYYRLNRDFTGIEELRRLVLGEVEGAVARPSSVAREPAVSRVSSVVTNLQEDRVSFQAAAAPATDEKPAAKRIRYDFVLLTLISFFILIAAIFIAHTNTNNIRQIAGLISEKTNQVSIFPLDGNIEPKRPDEMISKRWKVLSGSFPVFSTGGEEATSEKL